MSRLLRAAICFHLPCGLEDHAWPMGTTVCPEDVEFCQPVKYVWLPPPPLAFIPSSSCVVSTKRNFYLAEIFTLFIIFYDLTFFLEGEDV